MRNRILIILCILLFAVTPALGAPFWVEWHAPESDLDGKTVQVSNGTVRLNATIRGSVDYVEIERTYKDQQTNDRDIFRVQNLRNQTIHAGTKNVTQVQVRAFGESGGIDTTKFDMTVSDTTAPTLREFEATRVDNTTVAVEGVIYDATQPHFIRIQLTSSSTRIINVRTLDGERDLRAGFDVRRTFGEFERTVTLPRSKENITVILEDRAGNTRTVTAPIDANAGARTPTPTPISTPTPTPTTTSAPTSTPNATPAPTTTSVTTTVINSQTSVPASPPSGGMSPILLGLNGLLIVAVVLGVGILLW